MALHNKLTLSKRLAALRISFGLIWCVDAALKFQPAFYKGLLNFLMSKDLGEPTWLNGWFHFWYKLVAVNPSLFAFLILILEVLIAVSLIFGIARRLIYLISIPFCLLIWAVGEAFGGPYVAGTTDINAGLIYVLVFLFLYTVEGLTIPAWSLDNLISKHISWWSKIASPPNLAKSNSSKLTS